LIILRRIGGYLSSYQQYKIGAQDQQQRKMSWDEP